MMQYCLFFVVLVVVSNSVSADLTPAEYLSLLNTPPYRSFSGFPKPDIVTSEIDLQLQKIAANNHINLPDLYQLFAIMQSENVPLDQSIAWIDHLASQVSYEKTNMGMYGLPYPLYSQYMPPQVSKMQMPNLPMIRLYRREPAEGLVEAVVDDTAMNMKKGYNAVKNGLDKAYDNVMNFADKVAPRTTESMKNVVNALVGSGSSPSLSEKLQSNLRYMMADY